MLDDEDAALGDNAPKDKRKGSEITEDGDRSEEREGRAQALRQVWAEYRGTPVPCSVIRLNADGNVKHRPKSTSVALRVRRPESTLGSVFCPLLSASPVLSPST